MRCRQLIFLDGGVGGWEEGREGGVVTFKVYGRSKASISACCIHHSNMVAVTPYIFSGNCKCFLSLLS